MISFTVWGAPASKGSLVSWVNKKGKVITRHDSARLYSWTQAVAWAAKAARVKCASRHTPIYIRAEFQFLRPQGRSATRRPEPTVWPDIDKTARALLDALSSGIAYEDDSQVTQLTLIKRYADEALTHIFISHGVIPT